MVEPKTPQPVLSQDDPGFPPLRDEDAADEKEDDAFDYDSDFHEDGGGD